MAIILMVLSVVLWSFYPVLAAWELTSISISHFLLWTQVFSVGSAFLLLKLLPRARNVNYTKFKDYTRRDKIHLFGNTAAFLLSQVCLLFSFAHISKIGATLAFETWPIFGMYLTPILMKKTWQTIPKKNYLFVVIALAGLMFILFSELEHNALFSGEVALSSYTYLLLPLLGGLLMAVASALKAGVAQNIEIKGHPIITMLSLQTAMGWFFIPLTVLLVIAWPGEVNNYGYQDMAILAFVGVFIFTAGSLLYTVSLLKSKYSSISVLWYFMPVLSAAWFWWSGLSQLTDFIALGAILIISSNLLISARADDKYAYMATLVNLIIVGVCCYFTYGLDLGIVYFNAIAVPLTLYIIVVAFISDRLKRRDTQEKELGIKILSQVSQDNDLTAEDKKLLLTQIRGTLGSNDVTELKAFLGNFQRVKHKKPKDYIEGFDRLVVSKIQSTSFGDLFITAIIGFLGLGAITIYRPGSFIGDAYAVILSSAIVFIFFNIVDLSIQRKAFYLDYSETGVRTLSDSITENDLTHKVLSALLVGLMLSAFTLLFWFKHY